jgi:hypothetical protein
MLLSSRDLKRQLALANAVGSSPAWVPPPMRSAEDDLMIVHQDDSIIVKQDDLISCDDEDGGNDEEGGPDGTNFTMSTDSSDPESSDDDYRMKCGPWSVLEHQLLIDAVAEEGCHDELPVGVLTSENCLPVGWFRIADRVVKRTPLQCFLEWQLLLQSGFHSELGGSSVVSGNCFSMPSYW